MDVVWGGNSGRKPRSMWVWVLPQGNRWIVYSSNMKRAGFPLGLRHLFPTNRLFTEKHNFCWPENIREFNLHLQSSLICFFFSLFRSRCIQICFLRAWCEFVDADGLPIHPVIWIFIASAQNSISALCSAWEDLNVSVSPTRLLTSPPRSRAGISTAHTIFSTQVASKSQKQNWVQQHILREWVFSLCTQPKSLGAARKELCSQALVERGWLQSLWALGIHWTGKAFVVQALCWWLFKLFHTIWNVTNMSVALWFGSWVPSRDSVSPPLRMGKTQQAEPWGRRRLLSHLLHHNSIGFFSLVHSFPFHRDASNETAIFFNWYEATLYWNETLSHFIFSWRISNCRTVLV